MTQFLQWILDLDQIRLAEDAPLLLRWNANFPAWMLFGIALIGGAYVALVYRAERSSPLRRMALGIIRCAVIALVVAVLCRPSFVLQRNRVEPSYVALLVDASLSMNRRDTYRDSDLVKHVSSAASLDNASDLSSRSRLDLVKASLTREDNAPLRALLDRNAVQLFAFSEGLEPRAAAAGPGAAATIHESLGAIQANGASTDIGGALAAAIDSAKGRRLAAIVVMTDGQSTHPGRLRDALDIAADRQIPIFPARVGSPDRVFDVELTSVAAQESVFAQDVVAVEADVAARELSGPTAVVVNLIDERTREVVSSELVNLSPDAPTARVELRVKPTKAGAARYRVEAVPPPGETLTDNNSDRVQFAVLDQRVRVLYVEGYPRFEYRYLKNALAREASIELSVLLLEADEQFVQEGTDPIRRFPETMDELDRFDVLLLGDVDPKQNWLTTSQMTIIVDFVGKKGGGVGLIAGERAAPQRFRGTPLERLLPVRIDPAFQGRYDEPLISGFRPRLTAEGRRSRLFRFAAEAQAGEKIFNALPDLYWLCRTLGSKPGASVLAEVPSTSAAFGAMPLIVVGRYGAGKLFFQGTDDTWRWRRHTGELLHDSYWVQVVRELMPAMRAAQDRRFTIRTDRRVYPYGAPVHVQVEFVDPELLAAQRGELEMSAMERTVTDDPAGADAPRGVLAGRFTLHRIGPDSTIFEGAYAPPTSGSYVLETTDIPGKPGEPLTSAVVRVEPADLELRRPDADHETLERIALATGGRVLELDELVQGFAAIRDRSVQIPDDITEPLWDSKLVLLLFILMITLEWIARKAWGLV